MTADTSIAAFHGSAKKRSQREQDILDLLSIGDRLQMPAFTRLELANLMGLPQNCVTGPVARLIVEGKLVECETRRRNVTGASAKRVRLNKEHP